MLGFGTEGAGIQPFSRIVEVLSQLVKDEQTLRKMVCKKSKRLTESKKRCCVKGTAEGGRRLPEIKRGKREICMFYLDVTYRFFKMTIKSDEFI